MSRIIKENSVLSYRNPFDDYNANVLDPQLIIQYWCSPFNIGALKGFDENKFYSEKMPIVLQGSRGSGKTTILKYFSFPVQRERAVQNKILTRKQISEDGGTGFYLRCDDSFLDIFKAIFEANKEGSWLICFEHYLEMFFSKNILEMLKSLIDESKVSEDSISEQLHLQDFEPEFQDMSLDNLDKYISSEIKYLNAFKNNVLFTGTEFSPTHIWSFYELSGRLIDAISASFSEINSINYLLLIDEYENLPIDLQKKFNTMIKFCKPRITMRIGRRSENENIVTRETVNSVEYLREENDYRLIILDKGQNIKELQPYLQGIAEKRLSADANATLPTNIVELLGEKEDLDLECSNIANEKNLHMTYILMGNPVLRTDKKLLEEVLQIISYPQNRIAEMLNALWVARTKKGGDLSKAAQDAVDAMRAFFSKEGHPLVSKYRNDYNNKYRYALTVVLCTAYKKDKLYYSFNTICYLSEGNPRTFINMCKSIISDAMFYERNSILSTGNISNVSQSRAIREFANNEFNSVCSIIQNGEAIRKLILNIGNVFSEYHKDRNVRYPETNQFIFEPSKLQHTTQNIISIAESWSIIKKKETTQRLSASINKKGDLYTINKIYSPIFNISYRTRGGVNVEFSADEIEQMVLGQFLQSKLSPKNPVKKSSQKNNDSSVEQLTLFGEVDLHE